MGARGSRAWGHAMDMGRVHGGGGVRAGRAERAGMRRGPSKQSDRSTEHRKNAKTLRRCGWWEPAGIGRVGRAERAGMRWGPLRGHARGGGGGGGAGGHALGPCQGVKGMGAMRWTWEGCLGGEGESGEGGAGGHALGPFKGPWETCMGGRGVWVVAAMWDPGAMTWSRGRGHGAGVEGMGAMGGTCIHDMGGGRDGAMSHGCQGVEGMGAGGHGAMSHGCQGSRGAMGGGSHVCGIMEP